MPPAHARTAATSPVAPPVWGSLPSHVDPLFTGTSASCTRGIGRATVLGIPEGVLRARPLPLRVEPTVSGVADELHTRELPPISGSNSVLALETVSRRTGKRSDDAELHTRGMPSVLDCYEGGTAPTATVCEHARWLQLCAGLAG